jgi:AraC family transcriptional regulator of adaptative response / DNA-3-methyladenine glycosylase II
MTLDPEQCWRAHIARDPRFDGRFFTGVRSTGIYCRPVCPARHPLRRNVSFFACAAAAEEAGLRPCRRCRPETAPGSSAWRGSSVTVERALRLIETGTLDTEDLETLASRVGVGARHLRRLFLRELGTTPSTIAKTRRLHFARRLLAETKIPIADVAFHAGFASLRTFNDALRNAYGDTPSSLRRAQTSAANPTATPGSVSLRLAYRPPLSWQSTLDFLQPRLLPGIETRSADSWQRVCTSGSSVFSVEVTHHQSADALVATITDPPAGSLAALVRRLRRVFDLDADPHAVAEVLSGDPVLAPSVRANIGLRVPGAWDLFEILARAILGQQISVPAATTLTKRLIEQLGVRHDVPSGFAGGIGYTFPEPAVLAEADLSKVGLPKARTATLRSIAAAVADGSLPLEQPWETNEFEEALTSFAGIGPWTARYVAMRGLGDPDAFPDADLGLIRALEKAGVPAKARDLRARAENWRPWRAYGALHLWSTLGPIPTAKNKPPRTTKTTRKRTKP